MSPTYHDDPAAPVRWGILGTGGIAAKFAADLALLPGAEVAAVGSRTQERAREFVARLGNGDLGNGERRGGAPSAHASYADLVADDDVDAVYVATPHSTHCENTLLALRAGKAVLCEKPFALNAGQAREMVAEARSSGRFLMEAMWSRFLPHLSYVRELVAAGVLGDVRTVTAEHGQGFAPDAAHALFAPELGGGALLDLGIYPVSFACWMLGRPTAVTAVSDAAFTGVDAQTSAILQFAGGAHAVVTTTLETHTVNRATVSGTRGRVDLDPRFYGPGGVTVTMAGGEPVRREFPHEGNGLRHEAAEVGRCLRAGRTQSEVMPLDESVEIMAVLDEIRRQIGLTYPGERPTEQRTVPSR